MRSFGPPLVAAAALVTLAAGCGGRKQETPLHRLADERAVARGRHEPGVAEIDEVRQYVLAELPIVSLDSGKPGQAAAVGPDGTIEVPLACPTDLAGQLITAKLGVVAAYRIVDGKPSLELTDASHVEDVRCPREGEPVRSLRLGGLESGLQVSPSLVGYVAPEPRVESVVMTIPAGAILRLSIGIASPHAAENQKPARFVIRAESPAGDGIVVFERVLDPARRREDRGWVPVEIDLGSARRRVGSEVRLVFETEPVTKTDITHPAWADPTIVVPAPPQGHRRASVVLVSLDTLRADRLGCYGFPQPTSPHIDRLAAEGTLFEQAVTPATWTRPAHGSMLAGVFPCVHGMTAIGALQLYAEKVTPIAEILRRAGYATAAFTEDALVDPVTFQRGFGSFLADTDFRGPLGAAETTFAAASVWLDAHGADDFFLFVHTYQVHAPYTPPERYRAELAASNPTPPPLEPPPSAEAADDEARYVAEIRYVDDVLGRFVDGLAALGLSERVILIITSDHGEAFGEHGRRYHGASLYEEELHVPMIWRGPKRIAAGRRSPDLVGLADIVPTLLDLLGLPTPPWVQGVSLRSLLDPQGPGGRLPEARVLPAVNVRGLLALRGLGWKAIYEKTTPQIFDLRTDPQERSPVGTAFVAADREREAILRGCQEIRSLTTRTDGAAASPQAPPNADVERKLRALGYLDPPAQ